jgi:hypothetical protein
MSEEEPTRITDKRGVVWSVSYLSQWLGFSRNNNTEQGTSTGDGSDWGLWSEKFASDVPIGYPYLSHCDSISSEETFDNCDSSHLPISPWCMWFRSIHVHVCVCVCVCVCVTNPIKPFNYLTEGGSCSSPTDSFVSQGVLCVPDIGHPLLLGFSGLLTTWWSRFHSNRKFIHECRCEKD